MDETRRRRELIRELVSRYAISSQEELVDLLRRRDIAATQPTVSRDLEVLGIEKVRWADGRSAYALPEAGGLVQALRQFALGIDASGNLAVIRTPPGAAGAVASAIDGTPLTEVLATLQGDDTVLVVAVEGTPGRAVADLLLQIKERRP